jgi:DNA-directed RNA polymerase specialized sigma24 family protein
MGPEDALALVLSDLQGASTKELAIALQVGVSAAKMRLKRARERFRALYREQSQ